MSQHHCGIMGYHDGEVGYQRAAPADAGGPTGSTFGAEVELNADGYVIMKNALPDSGTNHDTGARSGGRRDSGIHHPGSHARGLGRLRSRALEQYLVRRQNHHVARSGGLQRGR